MKAVALALAAFAVGAQADWKKEFVKDDYESLDLKSLFSEWKEANNRGYPTIEEEGYRFHVFAANLDTIIAHNTRSESYKLRLNQFADLTTDEFKMKVHGRNGACYRKRAGSNTPVISTDISSKSKSLLTGSDKVASTAPDSIDWTDYNGKSYVTPVKNQGDCGSCWAFSTTGSIECRYAIKNGELNSLSEQQLVDCSDSYGNDGCDGGLMDDAFKYVEANGGLCSEDDYPYKGEDGTCDSSKCGTKYDDISSYSDVTKDSETDLMDAVAEGCVSVAIEADQFAFQFYSSGVLDGTCGTSLDHGVLVVGYGTDGSQEYWKVKNSWGSTWGESGYVLICRDCDKNGRDGECGILEEPSYPAAK